MAQLAKSNGLNNFYSTFSCKKKKKKKKPNDQNMPFNILYIHRIINPNDPSLYILSALE